MKSVLFIVHGFPPMGGAGVQRVVKFIKHLPEFGWQPLVLTALHDPNDLALPDPSLADDLPPDLAVFRSPCPDPFVIYRRFGGKAKLGSAAFSDGGKFRGLSGSLVRLTRSLMVPDTKLFWLPGALAHSRKIWARHSIDAIVSSSPWETVHLIAARLQKLHRTPWIADFRDPWTQAPWNPPHPACLHRLNRSLERMTLRRADRVVVTSRTTADGLLSAHPVLKDLSQRLHLIYNGYDESDFSGLSPKHFDRFTVVYSGRAIMPGRSPEPLLGGVASLLARRPDLADKLQIIFVGSTSSQAEALVARHGLTKVVHFVGYLPHRDSLSYVLGADLLYLNTTPECIPGKFPEYLRSGRPILGLMEPSCEVASLIHELRAGLVVSTQDHESVARTIEGLLGGSIKLDTPVHDVREFSRHRVSAQLAELLDSTVRGNP